MFCDRFEISSDRIRNCWSPGYPTSCPAPRKLRSTSSRAGRTGYADSRVIYWKDFLKSRLGKLSETGYERRISPEERCDCCSPAARPTCPKGILCPHRFNALLILVHRAVFQFHQRRQRHRDTAGVPRFRLQASAYLACYYNGGTVYLEPTFSTKIYIDEQKAPAHVHRRRAHDVRGHAA